MHVDSTEATSVMFRTFSKLMFIDIVPFYSKLAFAEVTRSLQKISSHQTTSLVVVFQSAEGPGVIRPVPRDVTPSRTCLSGNGATSPRSVNASSVPWGTAGSRSVRHSSYLFISSQPWTYYRLHKYIISITYMLINSKYININVYHLNLEYAYVNTFTSIEHLAHVNKLSTYIFLTMDIIYRHIYRLSQDMLTHCTHIHHFIYGPVK